MKHHNYAYTLFCLNESYTSSIGTFLSLKDAKKYAKENDMGDNWLVISSQECWKMCGEDLYIIRTLINPHLGAGFCGINVED